MEKNCSVTTPKENPKGGIPSKVGAGWASEDGAEHEEGNPPFHHNPICSGSKESRLSNSWMCCKIPVTADFGNVTWTTASFVKVSGLNNKTMV